MRHIICIALAILLTGCVTVPSPETVSQMCAREAAEIQARGRSTNRLDYNTVYARCVDSRRAYEVASRTMQSTRRMDSVDGHFNARNGDRAVTLRSQETATRHTYENRSSIRHENKWFVWGIDLGVKVTN